MSRLEVPLLGRKLHATGQVLLRAELDLWLRDQNGVLKLAPFLVDPGSEMTTMPANLAKQLDLPMPLRPVPHLIHSQTGEIIRNGVLRAQIAGMDGTEYVFPCYFLGDPNAPFGPSQPRSKSKKNLLGLTGVVDKISLLFDGTPTSAAAKGVLVVEKK